MCTCLKLLRKYLILYVHITNNVSDINPYMHSYPHTSVIASTKRTTFQLRSKMVGKSNDVRRENGRPNENSIISQPRIIFYNRAI